MKKILLYITIGIFISSSLSQISAMEKLIEHTTETDPSSSHLPSIMTHTEIAHAVEYHHENHEEPLVHAGFAQAVSEKDIHGNSIDLSKTEVITAQPIAYAESTEETVLNGKTSVYDAHGNKSQDIITSNGMQHITYYDNNKIIKESLALPDGTQHITYYPGNTDGVLMTDAMPEQHIATTDSIKEIKPTLSPVISKTVIFDTNKIKQQEIIHKSNGNSTLKYYDNRGVLESIASINADKSSIHNYYQSYPDYIVMTRSESYDTHNHKTHEWALNDNEQRIYSYYDAHGNLIPNPNPEEIVTNADGSTTRTDRDENGRIILQITSHSDGSTITLEYDDEDGYIYSKVIKNADGSGESIEYDSTGEIIGTSKTIKNLDGSFTTINYDAHGTIEHKFNTIYHTDGSIEKTYENDNNKIDRKEITYTDGSFESITYSENGNLSYKEKINKDKSSESTYYDNTGKILHSIKKIQNGNGLSTSTYYNEKNEITLTSTTLENFDGSVKEENYYDHNGVKTETTKFNFDGSSEKTYYNGEYFRTIYYNPEGLMLGEFNGQN